MVKAIKQAVLYLAIAVIGFLTLGLSAIYLPDNMMLHRSESSKVKDWLPGQEVVPSGMVLIERYKTTNKEVAKNYPNGDEVLQMIESWGREESYTNLYLSQDRCATAGPRSIRISIILHNDESGAQQYLEWLQNRDQSEAVEFQDIAIGNSGYLFWKGTESLCSEHLERQVEVVFKRNNAQGVVSIAGEEGQDTHLGAIALQLAKILDERVQKNTAPR